MKKFIFSLFLTLCFVFVGVGCNAPTPPQDPTDPQTSEAYVENKSFVVGKFNDLLEDFIESEIWEGEIDVVTPLKSAINEVLKLNKEVFFDMKTPSGSDGFDEQEFAGIITGNEILLSGKGDLMEKGGIFINTTDDGIYIMLDFADGVIEPVQYISYEQINAMVSGVLENIPLQTIKGFFTVIPEISVSDIEYDSQTNWHTIKNDYIKGVINSFVDAAFASQSQVSLFNEDMGGEPDPDQIKEMIAEIIDSLNLKLEYKISNKNNVVFKFAVAPGETFFNSISGGNPVPISKAEVEFIAGNDLGTEVMSMFAELNATVGTDPITFKIDFDSKIKDEKLDVESKVDLSLPSGELGFGTVVLDYDASLKTQNDNSIVGKIDATINAKDIEASVDCDAVRTEEETKIDAKLTAEFPQSACGKADVSIVLDFDMNNETNDATAKIDANLMNIQREFVEEEYYVSSDFTYEMDAKFNLAQLCGEKDATPISKCDQIIEISYKGKELIENKDLTENELNNMLYSNVATTVSVVATNVEANKTKFIINVDEGTADAVKAEMVLTIKDIENYVSKIEGIKAIIEADKENFNVDDPAECYQMEYLLVSSTENSYISLGEGKYLVNITSPRGYCEITYCYAESEEKIIALGLTKIALPE